MIWNYGENMKSLKLKWKFVKPPKLEAIPREPGIYIISTQQYHDDEYEVKYVGQTENLYERAKEHWSKKEKNKLLKRHIAERYVMKFSFSIVSLEKERDGLELFLYNTYSPPFNMNAPPGETVIRCTSLPEVRKRY